MSYNWALATTNQRFWDPKPSPNPQNLYFGPELYGPLGYSEIFRPPTDLSPTATQAPTSCPEEYDDFDEKEVAYKRYQRNDALMSKIMSETMVPMNSVPITKTKLNAMRDQVAALEAYQKREAADIVEVEKKHVAQLQKLKQEKETFDLIHRKLSRPITEPQIIKLSQDIYERAQLRRLELLEMKK